jgi:hypothetical protein
MPLDVNCPKCRHVFPVTEAKSAIGVQCPGCESDLTAEFRKRSTPAPGEHSYELLVSPGRPAGSPPPMGNKRPRAEEDDEAGGGGGGMAMVVFAGIGALVLALAGLGTTGYFLFTNLDTSDSTIHKVSTSGGDKSKSNSRSSGLFGGSRSNRGGNDRTPDPVIPNFTDPGGFEPPPTPKKTPETFELKPVTGPIPAITPPALPADPSNIDLGGKVGQVAVGGGGRFIVMHFPMEGKLGLFDVTTARFNTIPADAGEVRLAAGLSRAVLYVNATKIFRVYSLPDLGKQYDAAVDLFFGANSIAMGSRTNGPLLVDAGFGDIRLYDIAGRELSEIEGARGKPGIHSTPGGIRAAPDGKAFTTFDGFNDGQKTALLTATGTKWKVHLDFSQVPFPGPDGNLYGNGVVMNRSGQDQRFGGIGAQSHQWFVPSVSSGQYFLKVVPTTLRMDGREKKSLSVTVHERKKGDNPVAGSPTFAGLPEFDGIINVFGGIDHDHAYDHHLFLMPEAKLLVILAGSKDRLVLRKVDLR